MNYPPQEPPDWKSVLIRAHLFQKQKMEENGQDGLVNVFQLGTHSYTDFILMGIAKEMGVRL